MADAIRKRFGVESALIEGSGGVFDVHVDGAQVWSKHEKDRFPEHHEVLEAIGKLKGR
ncbi:MAG: SelT/SelW/SelH family protein [Phycisphaerales bacterium]|nr:MAG: SelT/SelW/SelH family protein [Phycisphaerales bacterium]